MANKKHIASLNQGVDAWNAWRQENLDISHPDFYGADLSGANLGEADLRRANPRNADLGEADLGGTGPSP